MTPPAFAPGRDGSSEGAVSGATRTVFESLAWLFAPADDPEQCHLVEVGEDWRFEAALADGHSAVVWGRTPIRQRPVGQMIRFALARERAIARVERLDGSLRCWEVERLAPIGRRGRLERAVRFGLMSGAIVRLGAGPAPSRVADEVATRAGHRGPPVRLRPSGDGSAVTRVQAADRALLLRLAREAGLKDVGRNAEALVRLADAGVGGVPRLAGDGRNAGVRWSTETALRGTPIRRLERTIVADVTRWLATLPRSDDGASLAAEERLELISQAFPDHAAALGEALEHVRRGARAVPGVLEHGDLWAGNLLARDGRLAGVVDWDTWHPAGVPGADLLQLLAMARRSRTREQVGDLWREGIWAEPVVRSTLAGYWSSLGIRPSDELAWLVGVSWWASNVTAGLRRGWQPAQDPRWVARNVDAVVPRLAAGPAAWVARPATRGRVSRFRPA